MRSVGCFMAALTVSANSGAYSGCCTALRINDGLVVASRGVKLRHLFEVAGVGHDGGELFKLCQLVRLVHGE